MRLNGNKVLSRKGDRIEIETPEGPAILAGYNPSLIEYETLDEAKVEKIAEMQRAFSTETERDFGSAWEALAVMVSEPRDPRLAILKTRLAKLRERVRAVEAAGSKAEAEGVQW